MKIGVFHWSFDEVGGGEILTSYLGRATNSKVYSIIKDTSKNPLGFVDVSPKLPMISRVLRKIRSMDYLCWSNIDVSDFGDFDVVVSSGLTARALITLDNVMHVHYNHSPARWLYDLWHHRRKSKGWLKQNFVLPPVAEFFRIWDESVDARVDYYFSNSPITQRRLYKYLKRESVVLYPPIEFNMYKYKEAENFYLFIGRLEEEKRPEEAIRACIKANKGIVVLGSGPLKDELKKRYGNDERVDLRGFVEESEKLDLLSRCKAVIYSAVAEDFGIVPIEAFASGKPVVCSNDGFPPLIVQNKKGVVTDGSVEGLARGISEIETSNYDPDELREFAKGFDFEVFKEKLNQQIKEWYDEFCRNWDVG